MKLQTNIAGRCWDSSVYAGLRDFHRAEGFDPDSQAVGIHLGYPPFRLCREVNSHFRRERSWYRENINIDIDATLVGDGDEINTDNQREDNKEEGDTRDWSGESEALVQEEHWNESPEEDNDHNNVDELRISFRESAAGVYSLEPEVEAIVPDLELHSTEQDIPAILGLLINIQLALIIFLAICWMYGNMQ
ncbi:hypothetical protein B0H16DRAFT_1626561 [Mycena metata]|uniref:Uncharacterized protein n=1 Tax=Mycena metata TaxID=1033252 RepID=A0AAD7H4Y6_9AGAR|nr:hypothetical protein B0H16DRAFT_1640431 [Mycena metata]KAJ7712060.1 hypothetical protein B0H16DRAFT_1626561 [Mycena metata]